MPTISNVKVGQKLYTVTRQKMGNTTMSEKVVHHVVVKEVDPDGNFVIASWNSNPAKKYYAISVAKWKVNDPRVKK